MYGQGKNALQLHRMRRQQPPMGGYFACKAWKHLGHADFPDCFQLVVGFRGFAGIAPGEVASLNQAIQAGVAFLQGIPQVPIFVCIDDATGIQ
jgi:hypothetical protein